MHRNPWFTLVLGLMVGLAVGYVLAERQAVPRATAASGQTVADPGAGLPEGHPPVGAGAGDTAGDRGLAQQAAELQQMLALNPDDPRIMTGLGNLYFDAGRWQEARLWYERSLEVAGGDPDVTTDLAVVYRNLGEPERSLELLDRAIAARPEHWQAWFNRAIVLQFDLHRHTEAAAALARLKEIAAGNPEVPDLSALEAEIAGS